MELRNYDLFRYKAKIAGLSRQTGFYRTDLWKHDLHKYDNIVIFGVEQMVSAVNFNYLYFCY